MSGIFGSVTIKGNRLTDFAQTTATVGIPLPFGYGIVPFDGNVTWAALPPKEHVSKKRQGKGGTKVETYTYTLAYMVSFCQGPIFGFWWIKRNGKVVWTQDPNAPIEDQAYAAKWAQKVQFYFGTETQLPDSTIESYEGTGNVSAHRGVAGFVMEDDDVTDGSGAVPTYEAACMCTPPEAYLTSKVYPQFMQEAANQSLAPTGGLLKTVLFESELQDDNVDQDVAPTGGDLFEVPPPEVWEAAEHGLGPTGGDMFAPPPAEVEPNEVEPGALPTGGRLSIPPSGTLGADAVDVDLGPTGGALFEPVGHMYWRLRITANNGHASNCGFTEIELRTSLGGPDITTTVANSGAATGSGQVNSSNRYSYAIDNSLTTGWLCNATTGWWMYNCAHPDHPGNVFEDVVQIAIRGSWNATTASPRDFVLEWSDDNSTWTPALTVAGETGWTGASDIRTFDV